MGEIERLRDYHTRAPNGDFCLVCDAEWPCDTIAVCDQLRTLRHEVSAMRPLVAAILRHYDAVAGIVAVTDNVEIVEQLRRTDAAVADEVRWYRRGKRPEGQGAAMSEIEDLREIELQQVEAERNELADRVAELEGIQDALRDILARRRIMTREERLAKLARNGIARPTLSCKPVWHRGRPGWV